MYLFSAVIVESLVVWGVQKSWSYFIFLCPSHLAHYYGKKKNKRIGRPPGGHSNLACALKKASKRRKRRKNVFVHKKKRSSASVDNTPAGSPQVRGLWCTCPVWKPGGPCRPAQTQKGDLRAFLSQIPAQQKVVCGPGADLSWISMRLFSPFPLGKWGWRWGWSRWRGWRFPEWGQYIWATGRATGRVRNVREKVVLFLSHPKWDLYIAASRQTTEKKRASHFFVFWWWE